MLKKQMEKKIENLESELGKLKAQVDAIIPAHKAPKQPEPPTEKRITKLIYDIEIRSLNFNRISYLDWEKIDKLTKVISHVDK